MSQFSDDGSGADPPTRRAAVVAAKQAYPLSLIFIFTIVCATVAGMWSGLAASLPSRQWDVFWLPATATLTAAGTGMLGGVIGLHAYRRWRRMFNGALVAALTGLVLGPLLLVDRRGIVQVVVMQVVGAVFLLVATVVLRFQTPDPLWQNPDVVHRPTSPLEP